MRKYFLLCASIICCILLQLGLSGCVSNHVSEGFGNAVWQSNDPYFYWHEDVSYREALYAEDVNYTIDRNAPEDEALTLYGKMEINGEITLIEFVRGDLDSGSYTFSIVLFRTNVVYIEGVYTYKKVADEAYDYEVNLTVQHAYDTNIINDTEGAIYGEETELPFESFTIYVTLDC